VVSYQRSYYYDADGQGGRCPADEALGISDGFTPGVKRLAVKMAALMPYGLAEETLAELAEIHMCGSRIWEAVQEAGVAANAHLHTQAEQASALPNPDEISPGVAKTTTRLAATMDGAKLHIRAEGWKEAKIGCIFEFVPKPKAKVNPDDHDRDRVMAKHIDYLFHLGPPEPFGQHVWAKAQQRGWLTADTTVVVGDGAPWIWNLADGHFADSTHIVDWYHAKQHLWSAAHLLAPDTAPDSDAQAAAWMHQMEDHLFAGQAHFIAQAISSSAAATSASGTTHDLLKREAGYFTDNATRMNYQHFSQQHLPIGSGTVESGAKQFKDRFTQAGMRWSRAGAVNLMPFRAAVMSRAFNHLWHAACP
jgi:hypothetical protein